MKTLFILFVYCMCDIAVIFFPNGSEMKYDLSSFPPEIRVTRENSSDTGFLSGPYLGQKPPGKIPELFAPGIISTEMEELNLVFFPGGRELIFSVQYGSMQWTLVGMKEIDGIWSLPEVLPFSGIYSDVDAFVSPNGKQIWFASNRPLSVEGEPKSDFDIWYVDRTEDGWSEPVNPGAPINSGSNEFFPCLTNSGTIYFQSWREGGPGSADIYYCRIENGAYLEAVPMPEPVNNSGFQGDTYVSPDETYAIISTTPEGQRGWSDLFISFKDENGQWGELINMGPGINSPLSENTPFVTYDGKYLFWKSRKREDPQARNKELTYNDIRDIFRSPKNGNGDIYWVSADITEELKK